MLPSISTLAKKLFRVLMQSTGASGDEETFHQWTQASDKASVINCISQIFIMLTIVFYILLKFRPLREKIKAFCKKNSLAKHNIDRRYANLMQEAPALAVTLLVLSTLKNKDLNMSQVIAFSMFAVHVCHRAILYSLLLRPSKTVAPYLLFFDLTMNTLNAYNQTIYHLFYTKFYNNHWKSLLSLNGQVTFFFGLIINIRSDTMQHYETRFPRDGFYPYVSRAHFIGETLQWLGYCLFCQTWPSFAWFVFRFCMLESYADLIHFNSYRRFKKRCFDIRRSTP